MSGRKELELKWENQAVMLLKPLLEEMRVNKATMEETCHVYQTVACGIVIQPHMTIEANERALNFFLQELMLWGMFVKSGELYKENSQGEE